MALGPLLMNNNYVQHHTTSCLLVRLGVSAL